MIWAFFFTKVPTISIHAPRAGSDLLFRTVQRGIIQISIHAPRAGSDTPRSKKSPKLRDFNPRSPCGERLLI